MNTVFRKLKSQNGESIGEVLVASLIVALGSVMFASMVSASDKLITRSEKAYKDYLEDHNSIENPQDPNNEGTESDGSLKITEAEGSPVKIQPNISETVKIYQDKDGRYFIYAPIEGSGK